MTKASLDLSNPKHEHAERRLRDDLMMWLGTVRPDGRPHMVPVWFLWHEGNVLIFSKNDQKIKNLKANSSVVVSLDDTKGGDDLVILDGEATLLESGTVTPALPAYEEKYAAKLAQFGWTGESMGKEYTEAISITPTKFRVW